MILSSTELMTPGRKLITLVEDDSYEHIAFIFGWDVKEPPSRKSVYTSLLHSLESRDLENMYNLDKEQIVLTQQEKIDLRHILRIIFKYGLF